MPSLERTWTNFTPRNEDRAGGRVRVAGWDDPELAAGGGLTSASVTAPSPGCPTPLIAGERRPRATNPSIDGILTDVVLLTFAVIPPGQSAELWLAPAAKYLSHSMRARSVSMV